MSRKISRDADAARTKFIKQLDLEAQRYWSDSAQVFWLGALEANSAEAGHEAVRKHLSREVTYEFKHTYGISELIIDPRSEDQQFSSEPDSEPDSTLQFAELADMLSLLPDRDQTILQDHIDQTPQHETARKLGCARQNITARLPRLIKQLRGVAVIRANPIDEADVTSNEALSPEQRDDLLALLRDQHRNSWASVRRALPKLTESQQLHVKARLRFGKVTKWARPKR